MSKKIQISFDEFRYLKALKRLKDNVIRLNKGKVLCQDITNNEITDFDFDAVKKWLKNHSSKYKNISAIANLLDKTQEFIDVGIIDGLKETLFNPLITIAEDGFYILTDDSQAKLKEKYTTFLSEDKIEAYEKLDKAVNLLNSLTDHDRASLQPKFMGGYQINLQRLNMLMPI